MDPRSNPEKETMVLFQNHQGLEVRATVNQMTRHNLLMEVYAANALIQVSEVFEKFSILYNGRTTFSGRGIATNCLYSGATLLIEVALDGTWADIDLGKALSDDSALEGDFNSFLEHWQQSQHISPAFKAVIGEMQSFLTEARLWLEQIEIGIRGSPNSDRVQLERKLVAAIASFIFPFMDAVWGKFEPLAKEVMPQFQGMHRAYLQRHLHPLLLSSPFAYRTFAKPLGYAGDYEMINMIMRDPFEGGSLFAKIVNFWLLKQPPAEAHRNRVEYLTRKLTEEALRVVGLNRKARILNLACGPAAEVQRFVSANALSDSAEISLLDFNEETLLHTQGVLEQVRTHCSRSTGFHFLKKNIIQLLKESSRSTNRTSENGYDFIYCAGLFDYLTDNVCQRLTALMFEWLSPGGLLVLTNVDANKPFHTSMEYMLEWHLIYRNRDAMMKLAPPHLDLESVVVKSDFTGVNLFLEIRKPINHG
jgi:extracellular factor (EF) 3-hydroxypalmitic acid methyl ester biosynthesis protein